MISNITTERLLIGLDSMVKLTITTHLSMGSGSFQLRVKHCQKTRRLDNSRGQKYLFPFHSVLSLTATTTIIQK